jgi:hypothetical protein
VLLEVGECSQKDSTGIEYNVCSSFNVNLRRDATSQQSVPANVMAGFSCCFWNCDGNLRHGCFYISLHKFWGHSCIHIYTNSQELIMSLGSHCMFSLLLVLKVMSITFGSDTQKGMTTLMLPSKCCGVSLQPHR